MKAFVVVFINEGLVKAIKSSSDTSSMGRGQIGETLADNFVTRY